MPKVPNNNTDVPNLALTTNMASTSTSQIDTSDDINKMMEACDIAIRQCLSTGGDIVNVVKTISPDIVCAVILHRHSY